MRNTLSNLGLQRSTVMAGNEAIVDATVRLADKSKRTREALPLWQGRWPPSDEPFGDLDGVGRRSLADLVAADE